MTEDFINSCDDEKLTEKALDLVDEALRKSKGCREAKCKMLPQHWRMVYTTFIYSSQVNNGGLHQFFWNTECELNSALREDLVKMEAMEHVKILDEALLIYEARNRNQQVDKLSWNQFQVAYSEDWYEALDLRFYELNSSPFDLLYKYIRKNPRLYTANAA